MSNEEDSNAVVIQLLENFHHFNACAAIKISCRLVGENNGGIVYQRACDRLIAVPEPGLLPVHHFAQLTLIAALRSVGLAIVGEQPYNWFSYEHADMMLLAQKSG